MVKYISHIIPIPFKYHYLIGIISALCLIVAGCSDNEPSSGNEGNGTDGYELSFDVKLDCQLSTRADDIDNYIADGKFNVLFFAVNGDFLFNASSNVTLTPDNSGYDHIDYKVADITDNSETITADQIKQYLKKNPFMIAVVANQDISWGIKNSALYSGSDKSVKNIKDLQDLTLEWVNNNSVIIPSEDNPIPMFGMQSFDAIPNWTYGEPYDISKSTDNQQSPKYISLIRSLAKVELTLKQQAQQVRLCNFNGTSRSVAVDLFTPTSESWKPHVENHDENCEWFAIQQHGPAPMGEEYTEESYKTWSDWFGKYSLHTEEPEGPDDSTTDSPHLFNPEKSVVTACDLKNTEPTENKDTEPTENRTFKYVIYVPDTNISEPSSDEAHKALVPYIEYTYDSGENHDDNDWRRIYFTDYSKKDHPVKSVYADKYDDYESNAENLKLHWPIMRNHKYSFSVNASAYDLVIQAKVVSWNYTPIKDVW